MKQIMNTIKFIHFNNEFVTLNSYINKIFNEGHAFLCINIFSSIMYFHSITENIQCDFKCEKFVNQNRYFTNSSFTKKIGLLVCVLRT